MERRTFLRATAIGTGMTVALGFSMTREALGYSANTGPSPYGPLQGANGDGIMLPAQFTSRVIARTGNKVPGTAYTWHRAPDGGACFADGGGWIYVSNSEVIGTGGVGAVKFGGDGRITDAYSILSGTNQNCAGGATPWNTWLSCEEVDRGYVYETYPFGGRAAVRRPALGRFKHEAAAADPDRRAVYLTEDEPDGCFYRFVPTTWGDMSGGTLQVLIGKGGDAVDWAEVPDPSAGSTRTRKQIANAKKFNGGEGCFYRAGTCFFTTKGDNRVWSYDAVANTLAIAYDDSIPDAPLTGVDNITGRANGELFVAEDGGNMEICVITPDDIVAPFLRVQGQSRSELCGVAFNPAGNRLYFSSQRGTSGSSSGGITYEVTGPFH